MGNHSGDRLHPYHQGGVVLSWDKATQYLLWLECGHTGGLRRAGGIVLRKRCPVCHELKRVTHADPT